MECYEQSNKEYHGFHNRFNNHILLCENSQPNWRTQHIHTGCSIHGNYYSVERCQETNQRILADVCIKRTAEKETGKIENNYKNKLSS